MTDSHDARTPSASVHALSGSTPPGPGTTMQPFGVAATPAAVAEMPDPFTPLGTVASSVVAGLADRRAALAQADAEVIDLATRVTSLAERESRIWGRRSQIEDAVFRALPPQPTRPEMQGGVTSTDTSVDGVRTVAVTTPAGWDEEHRAREAAYEAAVAERDGQEAEIAARLGLPRLEKLAERASRRLDRWGLRLAETVPQTQAGLRAKAAASTVMNERGSSLDPCWQALAHSVSADALRLISAEADAIEAACADPFSAYHLEIVGIQEALTASTVKEDDDRLMKRWGEIDQEALVRRPKTLSGALGALEYARREHHQFNVEASQDLKCEVDPTNLIVLHLLDGALEVMRRSFGASAAAGDLRSVPLAAGFASILCSPEASRDVAETYRSWLYGELRMLNLELDGDAAISAVRQDNPGAAFHFPADGYRTAVPKPSTRADAVLGLLGLMPSVGDAASQRETRAA